MNSTSTAPAILQQLDAVLQLVETLSTSLTALEIMAVRQSLLHAYVSMGQALILRNLETDGITFIGKSHSSFLDRLLIRVWGR